MIVWHYTYNIPSHFQSILRDGELKREGETGEYSRQSRFIEFLFGHPAVWFSSHPIFEPTAIKNRICAGQTIPGSLSETLGDGARIGVDSAGMLTWKEYKSAVLANVSPDKIRDAKRCFKGMEEAGNPYDWRASLQRVPKSSWASIQLWIDGRWQDFTGQIAVAA